MRAPRQILARRTREAVLWQANVFSCLSGHLLQTKCSAERHQSPKLFRIRKRSLPCLLRAIPTFRGWTNSQPLPANGERVRMEFKSNQIDSSTLIILIDTPDKQHAEVNFDLQSYARTRTVQSLISWLNRKLTHCRKLQVSVDSVKHAAPAGAGG